MTVYTKLHIIHIDTGVHISMRGTRGKPCLSFLPACISVLDSTGGLNVYPRSNNNNDKEYTCITAYNSQSHTEA